MYNVSKEYKSYIGKPSRNFQCRITIGNIILDNKDIIEMILDYPQPTDGFSIGNTVSQSLDLTFINKGQTLYSTNKVKVEIGLYEKEKLEYILMGYFNIDEVKTTDHIVKLTCFDNMIKFESPYFSTLGETSTLKEIAAEVSRITGVEFVGTLPSYRVKKLDGYICREILSYMASLCGGNAIITREGKATIVYEEEVDCSINGDNYFEYTREKDKYKIGKISCEAGEKEILSMGELGSDSMELQFENPWMNKEILNNVYKKLNGFQYLGYNMKWQGDLSLDPGDIITCTDVKGIIRKLPILSKKLIYTGGLNSEIGAKGQTKNKNEFNSGGSNAKKLERVTTDLALVNKALVDVAYVNDLTANNIKVDVIEGGTAVLQDILTNFISGDNGQFIHLTSGNVVIDNAVIKDVIASSISVADLKASNIDTNKFNIVSSDGGISIVGATQQFKDKKGNVRIQMGQDVAGSFNFIVKGEDGTTTLIDSTGIKPGAIADNLIKSDMIAENAITSKQIDYKDFVSGYNSDTNTSFVKSNKILFDKENQTLDVVLSSMESTVEEITKEVDKTVKVTDIEYYLSTSTTQLVGGSWSTTAPQWVQGKYMWQRVKTIYIDSTKAPTYSSPTCIAGAKGDTGSRGDKGEQGFQGVKGNKGDSGTTITSITEEYYLSTSKDTQIGGIWVTSPPTWSTGKYMWTRSKIVYANPAKIEYTTPLCDSSWEAVNQVEASIKVVKEVTETHTRELKESKDGISDLIGKTTITKENGEVVQLKDEYNITKRTLDSYSNIIGEHTTNIDKVTGQINEVNTRANNFERTLDKTRSEISKIETNYVTTTAMKSAITQGADGIKSEVSTAYLNKNDATKLYATKTSMELTDSKLRLDFSASGGHNILVNSKGKNNCSGWYSNAGGGIGRESDSQVGTCFKTTMPNGIGGRDYKLKNNTDYVYEGYIYSRAVIGGSPSTPFHFWCSNSKAPGQKQCTILDFRQSVSTTNKWIKCYVHFRTASIGEVWFRPYIFIGSGNTFEVWVTELSLSESTTETKWTPHPEEIYSGNTEIDAHGVTIYNGALTVKNKAGGNVIEADGDGNITFMGKLQPHDYQVHLFGNNCCIDGSADAIRMQYSPSTYISMDSVGYCRIFNQNSDGGRYYVSIGYESNHHVQVFGNTTMVKLLNGPVAQVQARWTSDTDYCSMAASQFIAISSEKYKTNIEDIEIEKLVRILKENHVKQYNLKQDIRAKIKNSNLEGEVTLEDVEYSGADPDVDKKIGLVLEMLTEEGKQYLNPNTTEGIDQYAMVSILWKIVQYQQNEIENLKQRVYIIK